jgi:predicted XRE-type DNA-binding protein
MTTIDHEESSGNVYADLGLPDAEAMKRKSRIAAYIQMEIENQGLTKKLAASRLDIPMTRLAAILRGQFREIDELILVSYLHRLGRKSIKVTVEFRDDQKAETEIVFAA